MLIDIARVMAAARDLRVGQAPYSTHAVLTAHFPDILVTGADLPENIHEQVSVLDEERTILYNRRLSSAMRRVAVMHGLGHILFDLHAQRMCQTQGTGSHAERLEELRADYFAGELLAPLSDVDQAFKGVALFPRDPLARRHFEDQLDHVASRLHLPRAMLRARARLLSRLRKCSLVFLP
jgi:Zn-dependent peptidase ImmA (M78 family)